MIKKVSKAKYVFVRSDLDRQSQKQVLSDLDFEPLLKGKQ